MNDDEYFWEPVPAAWSVRQQSDGGFAPDWAWPAPDPAPVTTIGWRLCHVWVILALRADFHFGAAALTLDALEWPATASAALDVVDQAYEAWTTGVSSMSAADADRHSDGPPGTIDGQFPLWAVVLHVNRELIHHGAEIALLRDLYRARADASRSASSVPQL